jgi:hypothetical protein
VRQLIKTILREQVQIIESSDEKLEKLIGQYISSSYPTAKKIKMYPKGGNVGITSLTLPDPVDERDNLILKFDAYGMPDYNINPDFLDSVKAMFGGDKKIKRLIFKWFDEKEVDHDLLGEGLRDTSWQNDDGDKVTLIDLLDATEDIPVKNIPVDKIKSKLLTWDDDDKEVSKIEKADLQYPILIFVDGNNKIISIIDGHHRAQKAVRNKLKTIKAKLIPINSLPKNMRKVFSHLSKQEEKEGAGAYDAPAFEMEPDHTTFKHVQKEAELTERCWKGYTQKGMKTMFGKRYPNCVKKK